MLGGDLSLRCVYINYFRVMILKKVDLNQEKVLNYG